MAPLFLHLYILPRPKEHLSLSWFSQFPSIVGIVDGVVHLPHDCIANKATMVIGVEICIMMWFAYIDLLLSIGEDNTFVVWEDFCLCYLAGTEFNGLGIKSIVRSLQSNVYCRTTDLKDVIVNATWYVYKAVVLPTVWVEVILIAYIVVYWLFSNHRAVFSISHFLRLITVPDNAGNCELTQYEPAVMRTFSYEISADQYGTPISLYYGIRPKKGYLVEPP